MNKNTYIRFLFISMIIGSILILSACGDDNNSTSEPDADDNNSEITLDSEMGEVTIPTNAERVIAPYHEDALLALGVTPVAKWAIGQSIQDYLEPQLKDVPSIEWNLPLEQVLNHDPDLIILTNDMESYEGTYEDYNKIAPTFVMTKEMTNDWQKQIETFGAIFQKDDTADDVLNDYEEKITTASEQLSESIGDETVAAIWLMGDQFYLFEQDRHSAEVLYNKVGLNQPSLVNELGEAEAQWNAISIEKLSELNADHVFLLAAENEQGLETLDNSSVWQSTPAAENGNIHVINDPSNWTNKGLIASEKTIDDVLETLAN